jgi:hypothetical protein
MEIDRSEEEKIPEPAIEEAEKEEEKIEARPLPPR